MIQQKVQVWILSVADSGERMALMLKLIPKRGGFWQPVTGGVEPQEAVIDGAKREAVEESGFAFSGEPQALGIDFEFEGMRGPSHETVFWIAAPRGCPKPTLDPREHEAWRWVSLSEAEAMVGFPAQKQAARKLAGLSS